MVMEDEWDLHAVVRSCAATGTTIAPPLQRNHCPDNTPILPYHQAQLINNPIPLQFTSPRTGIPVAINPRPLRQPKRKNQAAKIVRRMPEELNGDAWAWRKYGQKPIKGSPYPRNYYRCSTSKGCAARKQVERSPDDATILIVSYTGEHTHPRPSHRTSHGKISTAAAVGADAAIGHKAAPSSSSTASGSSVSLNTKGCAAVDVAEEEVATAEDEINPIHNDYEDVLEEFPNNS